jgi:phosphate/sulfate permease
VILLGAVGIVIGLALFGPRIIRTVGSELTKLDPTRAYCVLMAAALTVILASQLGLPVSTTHVTVGAVLGVGFLREYLRASTSGRWRRSGPIIRRGTRRRLTPSSPASPRPRSPSAARC